MPFTAPALGEAAADPKLLTQQLQFMFDQLENELRKGDPVGRIVLWPDTADLPEGWVECDGATYDKVKFPEVCRVLGVTASTFSVPTLSGPSGTIYMIRVE